MSRDYRKKIIANLNKKAYGSITVTGPETTITGQDAKGKYEIFLEDVDVYVDNINYSGPSGDGWNEPREPGGIEDYEIKGTNIGIAEKKWAAGKQYDADNLPIKYYPDTEEEETVTNPVQIKAISDFYVDRLDGELMDKFSEKVDEAYREEVESRQEPPDRYDDWD